MPPVLIATVSYLQCCFATRSCLHIPPLTVPSHLADSQSNKGKNNITHKNFIFRVEIHCPRAVVIALESQLTSGRPSLSRKQQNKL